MLISRPHPKYKNYLIIFEKKNLDQLITISMTSTSASMRKKYMYCIKSFLICMLFSSTCATVNIRSLHFCHNLFLFSRKTMSSSSPPSDMIHQRSMVPVCTSVLTFTGQLSMPFVIIKADSSWLIILNVSICLKIDFFRSFKSLKE